MKKKSLKNLRLNKIQVSKISGGWPSGPTNDQTNGEETCQQDCVSAYRTCISEYQTACEPIKTYERECADHVKTINPATRTC